MKRLSKRDQQWFHALRTERRAFNHEFRPNPFDDMFDSPKENSRRQWFLGMISIAGSAALIFYSFSPVMANPVENLPPPPNNVLIPMDEVVKGQINVETGKQSSSEQSPNQQTDHANDQDKQVESSGQQKEETKATPDDNQNHNKNAKQESESKLEEKSIKQESQSKSIDTQSNHQHKKVPDGMISESTQSSAKDQPDADLHQTEDGGKLPETATPWTAFMLRGLGLVLLGIGLRSIQRVRTYI